MDLGKSLTNFTVSIPGFVNKNESRLDFIWKNLIDLISTDNNIFSAISYSQVIEYFISDKPDNPSIKKGAVLVEHHSKGYLITQIFFRQ